MSANDCGGVEYGFSILTISFCGVTMDGGFVALWAAFLTFAVAGLLAGFVVVEAAVLVAAGIVVVAQALADALAAACVLVAFTGVTEDVA